MTPIEASILSNCRIESNRIEKSIRQRESNRIESNFFSPESECSTLYHACLSIHTAGRVYSHYVTKYKSSNKALYDNMKAPSRG